METRPEFANKRPDFAIGFFLGVAGGFLVPVVIGGDPVAGAGSALFTALLMFGVWVLSTYRLVRRESPPHR